MWKILPDADASIQLYWMFWWVWKWCESYIGFTCRSQPNCTLWKMHFPTPWSKHQRRGISLGRMQFVVAEHSNKTCFLLSVWPSHWKWNICIYRKKVRDCSQIPVLWIAANIADFFSVIPVILVFPQLQKQPSQSEHCRLSIGVFLYPRQKNSHRKMTTKIIQHNRTSWCLLTDRRNNSLICMFLWFTSKLKVSFSYSNCYYGHVG